MQVAAKAEFAASFTLYLSVKPEFPHVGRFHGPFRCDSRLKSIIWAALRKLRTKWVSKSRRSLRMDYEPVAGVAGKIRGEPTSYFAPLANEYRQRGAAQTRDRDLSVAALAAARSHEWQIVYGQALYETGEFDEARKCSSEP